MTLEDATQSERTTIVYRDGSEETTLLFYKLEGHEELSQLYEWRVELLSKTARAAVAPGDWIGKDCYVESEYDEGGNARYFAGLCIGLRWLGYENQRERWEAVLRPHLWLLTRRTNSRIYQEKTLQQILEDVFGAYTGLTTSFGSGMPTATIPYCVQYQETDFAFVSRLLEKYGLHYYFTHADSGETLKIGGPTQAHQDHGDAGTIPFYPPGEYIRDTEYFDAVAMEETLRSDKTAVNDYNYETATTPIDDSYDVTPSHNSAKDNELYEYPYGYSASGDAHDLAVNKLEAERAEVKVIRASGAAMVLGSGSLMKIRYTPLPHSESDSSQYLVVRARHRLIGDSYRTTSERLEEPRYRGSVESIPSDTNFRVPRRTPWPRMAGPQTAKVVDENMGTSTEIDVDDQGRILVHFHWERDNKPSCRLRVAQPWAGNQWGTSFIPRTGMEVVVDFVDGDPDRPLVTGAVYNSANVYPVETSNKTRSGVRSNSSEGGNGFNFFGFDDSAGNEEVYLHAQKDYYRKVEHDEKVEVTNDRTTDITEGNRTETISQGNDTLTISQGDLTIDVTAGTVSITAGTKIELTCGSSKITMDTTSITIESVDITVEATASVTAKGAQAEVNGSAQTTIKGGTVMIN